MSITIITACDLRYQPVAQVQQHLAASHGHAHVVYSLDGRARGRKFIVEDESFQKHGVYQVDAQSKYPTRARFKPRLILEALRTLPTGARLLWLDADALPLRLVELPTQPDVLLTARQPIERNVTRPAWLPRLGWCNAGVIGIRNTPAGVRFVRAWAGRTDEIGGDQHALNQHVNPDDRQLYPGEELLVDGAGVYLIDGKVFNNPFYPQITNDVVIAHLKTERWRDHLPTIIEQYCPTLLPQPTGATQ